MALPIVQGLELMGTGVIAGFGLLMLGLSWLSNRMRDEVDEGSGAGCAFVGVLLLAGAGYLAIRVLTAG